jgi:hypothetical protein
MKTFLKFLLISLFCLSVSSCFIRPRGDFEEYIPPPKPDYSNENNWAALPTKKDKAHLVPENSNLKENEDSAQVDVFFIHPTTYYRRASWNADVNDKALNKFTDKTTIMHQASVFNECCKIYAPRYRQATLYSFMDKKDNGTKALELAYQDVKDAFNYYVNHYNHGRPFIIASHSQGSRHAKRLLAEVIEKDTALYHRMVAAYIIGYKINKTDFTIIQPCHSANETNCFISWNTVLRGKTDDFFRGYVCTNPLSWTIDTTYQSADKAMGGVPSSFDRLDKGVIDAQVIDGLLMVNHPHYPGYPKIYGNSYHLVDYNLFYLNIRENVKQRIKAYFEKNK